MLSVSAPPISLYARCQYLLSVSAVINYLYQLPVSPVRVGADCISSSQETEICLQRNWFRQLLKYTHTACLQWL